MSQKLHRNPISLHGPSAQCSEACDSSALSVDKQGISDVGKVSTVLPVDSHVLLNDSYISEGDITGFLSVSEPENLNIPFIPADHSQIDQVGYTAPLNIFGAENVYKNNQVNIEGNMPRFASPIELFNCVKMRPQVFRDIQLADICYDCPDLRACLSQQNVVFGFSPLTPLDVNYSGVGSTPSRVLNYENFDPLALCKGVWATGKHNCQQAREQLPSLINYDYLKDMASGYRDHQVTNLLRYGFPLKY